MKTQNNSDFIHQELNRLLKMSSDYNKIDNPIKDGFEKIHKKAMEQNVSIDNAKDFLNNLSKEELTTLTEYSYLDNKISIEHMNNEGAYNLLLHHYEKSDFNNDGIIFNGHTKIRSMLPLNMPKDDKEAVLSALEGMSEKAKFASILMINPPNFYINKDGILSSKENNTYVDKNTIDKRLNHILNPLSGEVRNEEILHIFNVFKKNLNEAYNIESDEINYHKSNLENDSRLQKAKLSSNKLNQMNQISFL